MMLCKIYNIDGLLDHEITFNENDYGTFQDIDLPTHGSISIEILPGKWLSITTSEWMSLYYGPEPETYATLHEKYMKRVQEHIYKGPYDDRP